MTGRPPTTTEGEIRALKRRLRGPHGALSDRDRLEAMRTLFDQITNGTRYGLADHDALIRLAAHATAWAEQTERDAEVSR